MRLTVIVHMQAVGSSYTPSGKKVQYGDVKPTNVHMYAQSFSFHAAWQDKLICSPASKLPVFKLPFLSTWDAVSLEIE